MDDQIEVHGQEEQADKPEDPGKSITALRAAVERIEKEILAEKEEFRRRNESRAMEAPESPRQGESRRHQALQWALKLLELKSEGLPLTDMQKAVSPEQVVKDARVLEKYLKGTTPRTPRS